jgi:hypothetical protein
MSLPPLQMSEASRLAGEAANAVRASDMHKGVERPPTVTKP